MSWFNHQLEKDFPTEKKTKDFDLALGLHTCGLLADAILALARKRRSSVCLVPCCYGQAGSWNMCVGFLNKDICV